MARSRAVRILIVEDEPLIADLYRDALAAGAYRIEMAHNKQTAIEKIQHLVPQLILLDLLIPIGAGESLVTYDHPVGFDILEWIAHHPQYHTAKVVVLTNLDADQHKAHAEKLGADEYYVKSNIEPREIARRVAALASSVS